MESWRVFGQRCGWAGKTFCWYLQQKYPKEQKPCFLNASNESICPCGDSKAWTQHQVWFDTFWSINYLNQSKILRDFPCKASKKWLGSQMDGKCRHIGDKWFGVQFGPSRYEAFAAFTFLLPNLRCSPHGPTPPADMDHMRTNIHVDVYIYICIQYTYTNVHNNH